MFSYSHKVQYYETDKMGIVHHSNYIRWFEEARSAMLEEMGISYDYLESIGVITPIISVNANYKSMTRFGETVVIKSKISKYNGIRLSIDFQVFGKTGELKCEGQTSSCFINPKGRPRNIKKEFPKIHEIFEKNSHTS